MFDQVVRQRFCGTLLAMWQSFSIRYRKIKAKVFLREDLFEASQLAFPDASKLGSRSVSLDWNTESLYRLLIRHMAAISPEIRAWIMDGVNRVHLEEHGVLGWMPLHPLPEMGRPATIRAASFPPARYPGIFFERL